MIRPAAALSALIAAAVVTALATAAPAAPQHRAAQGYSDRMAALTDIQRLAAVRRALQDNGLWCPRVTAAAYQQPVKNLVMWVAACAANGPAQRTLAGTVPQTSARYGLFIGPDGSVQASSCADLTKVGFPACRALPAMAPKRR